MGGPTNALLLLAFLGLIALVILIVGVSILVVRRRKTKPVCGACGYAVAGLEALKCPECGSDLREVGIKGGRPRRAGAAT
jgi:ribosomal protein L34E